MMGLLFFICLVVSFLFSGIESGVLSVNRVRLRHHARRGEEAALTLDAMLLRMERLMTTVVIITSAANVVAIALLYTWFTAWLGIAGAIGALAVALPVFVFGLEFLPKAIFRRFPYRTLVIFARILAGATWLLSPVTGLGSLLVKPLFRSGREIASGRIASVEALRRTVELDSLAGRRSPAEQAMIENILDFRSLRAGDLMQPLEEVPAVAPETEVTELLRRAAQLDAKRFLVRDADGELVGLVRTLDFLFDGVQSGRVQSYMRRVVTIRAGERAMEALRRMRAARLSLAVVHSRAGKPIGVLTADHLVNRLLRGR